jgi:hypothetical protein
MAAQSTAITIAEDSGMHPDPTTGERSPQLIATDPPYGWNIWYGPITRRWWALPPAWYHHVPGLLEAGDQDTLAALIQQAEDGRPRFDRAATSEANERRHMTVAPRRPSRASAEVSPASGGRTS